MNTDNKLRYFQVVKWSDMMPSQPAVAGGGGAVIVNGTGEDGDDDDDGLSYSSTEHEVSLHDGQPGQQPTAPAQFNYASFASDTVNVMRLQEQLREAQRKLDKERNAKTTVENKRKTLEKEKEELIQKLEDVMRARSNLEQTKIDLDAKIRNIQYSLTEEVEKRKNSEILYNKTKEQLARKDEQYTDEVEAKQKSDLALRNIQMELRTSLSNVKQLEDDKEDMSRQLGHEKNAKLLQEQINEEQLRFQQTLNEDLNKSDVRDKHDNLADALSRLEVMDENRKQQLDTIEKVKAELYATKMELERQRARSKDDHEMLSSENEELHLKIDELKSDIKLNEEALAHASLKYNLELSSVKTDNSKLSSTLETEKATRDKLQAELDSLKNRLETAMAELEKAQEARSEIERSSQREREEWSRVLERREQELTHLKDTNQGAGQRLTDTEAKVTRIENELHIANATLVERTNQLTTIQKELEQRRNNQDNMDDNYRKEKEDNARLQAKLESTQERVSSLQHETLTLKQQLDEVKLRAAGEKGEGAEALNIMLTTLRSDHDKATNVLERKNSTLQEQLSKAKDTLHATETQRSSLEQELRNRQQELAETTRKLSVAEASLDLANRSKDQTESERIHLKTEVERLQVKLTEAKEAQLHSQSKVTELTERCERAEQSTAVSAQQLAAQSGNMHGLAQSKSELEETLHRLELENTKLEAALKHETEKVETLQKELDDSNQVRNTMGALLSNLKSSHAHLEDKLAEAAAVKTLATHDAEDSKQLWESEVKSRSKLGLRIAQLEREKQDAQKQVDEEKRKTRKAMELRKASDTKLSGEMDKSTQLQREVAALRAHLKIAKKKLKELEPSGANPLSALTADFTQERTEMERTLSTVRRQLSETQVQLEQEQDGKDTLDGKTRQLQQELTSLRTMEKSYSKLDKIKRRLEEEVSKYKASFIDRTELEKLRTELEAKSRLELNKKLMEVNAYLDNQSCAMDKLQVTRDCNDVELRKDFEKQRRDLQEQIDKLRRETKDSGTFKENVSQDVTRYKEMYESELKLRERLSSRLEQANDKANKAQHVISQLQLSSSPGSQNGWASPYLGKHSPNHGINDILSHKMKQELDRSIAKHLEKAPTLDISPPVRGSAADDSMLNAAYDKSRTEYMNILQKNYYV